VARHNAAFLTKCKFSTEIDPFAIRHPMACLAADSLKKGELPPPVGAGVVLFELQATSNGN